MDSTTSRKFDSPLSSQIEKKLFSVEPQQNLLSNSILSLFCPLVSWRMFLILKNQYGKRLKMDIAYQKTKMIRIFSNSAYKNSFKILQFVHNNPQPSQMMPILRMHFSKHIIEVPSITTNFVSPIFFSQGGVCEFCRAMTSSFWFKHILYNYTSVSQNFTSS